MKELQEIYELMQHIPDNTVGATIAHMLVDPKSYPLPENILVDIFNRIPYNILKLTNNKNGDSVAHSLAKRGKFPIDGYHCTPLILMSKNYERVSVAEILVKNSPDKFLEVIDLSEEILSIQNSKGQSIGWMLAESNPYSLLHQPKFEYCILRIRNKCDGETVAHAILRSMPIPKKYITKKLLNMQNRDGYSVMYEMVRNGYSLPTDKIDVESLMNDTTTAHKLLDLKCMENNIAKDRSQDMNLQITFETDKQYFDVMTTIVGDGFFAHRLAEYGIPVNKEFHKLKNKHGVTVGEILENKVSLTED